MSGMQIGMLDSLYNMLLLVFWFRIWTDKDRNLFFNPYLAPFGRLSDSAVAFLRPVFRKIPDRLIAATALVFLIVFRGLAMPQDIEWELVFGIQLRSQTNSLSYLYFSFLSFAMFLFTIWGISLIYVRTEKRSSSDHATGTLYYLSRPFSDIKPELRPATLLAVGIVLAILFNSAGRPALARFAGMTLPPDIYVRQPGLTALLMKSTVEALAAWVQVLPAIRSMLLILIIGSWVAMFASAQSLMVLCRGWIDFLLGPLRRYPIRIGMIDLTPIVFFIGVGFAFQFLMSILTASYGIGA
jgi:uncharacterized protein YggT (Ycf19 family)